MTTLPPSAPIEFLDTVDSTMDAARSRVQDGRVTFDSDGSPSSGGLVAEEQTAGRGQRGRSWHASRRESLCATYYIRHRFDLPSEAVKIPLMVGVVAAGLIQGQLPLTEVRLKWPNDILIRDKKAGGVLVELVRASDGCWTALVGVGINVSTTEFPIELRGSATSLAIESSDASSLPTPIEFAHSSGSALSHYAGSHNPDSFGSIIRNWRRLDASAGRRYEVDLDGKTIAGTAEGIDDSGALILRFDDGSQSAVTSASSLREIGL